MEVNDRLYCNSALPPAKQPTVRIGYDDRWAPETVWTLWRREKSYIAGESNPGGSARSRKLNVYETLTWAASLALHDVVRRRRNIYLLWWKKLFALQGS
jgi:hypothetical protein